MSKVKTVLIVLATWLVLSLLCTFPTMWLWNALMPKLFNLTTLTFWQTFGLQLLIRMFTPYTAKIKTS